MDPKMGSEGDPVWLILGDPFQNKALQGPFNFHIDLFFSSDIPLDNGFTFWFEVNSSFSPRDIAL